MKNAVYFTTINEVKKVLREVYQDPDLWRRTSVTEVFKDATRPHDPDVFNDFNFGKYFSDMDDEEFINSINSLPIFPLVMEDKSDSDCFPNYMGREIFAFAIANYLYEQEHAHDYFEIDCVLKGECEQNFEDECRVLTEGSLTILSPGSRHSICICNDDCCAIRICLNASVFDKAFFEILSSNSLLSAFYATAAVGSPQPNYLMFQMGSDRHIKNIVKSIFYETYQSDNYSVKGALSCINILFCHLLRHFNNVSLYRSSAHPITSDFPKILYYIQSHYNTVSLENLSQEFHFSISHLSRTIKEKTGQNFSQIVQSLKLKKAIEYLLHSDLSIEEITEKIGYESQSYLSRMFKREIGVSPQQYRRIPH